MLSPRMVQDLLGLGVPSWLSNLAGILGLPLHIAIDRVQSEDASFLCADGDATHICPQLPVGSTYLGSSHPHHGLSFE